MFLSITISAKIGKDYDCRRIGSIQMTDSTFKIDFPRDMDMTQPFFMICEPDLVERSENWGGFKVYKDPQNADNQEVDGFGDRPLSQDISEIKGDPTLKRHTEKLLEKEAKHYVPRYPKDDPVHGAYELTKPRGTKRHVPRYEDSANEVIRQIVLDKEKE